MRKEKAHILCTGVQNAGCFKDFMQIIWLFRYFALPLHPQTRNLHRGVEQLVARQAHNLEVACSSPASATATG